MESVCLGKCLPSGGVSRRKSYGAAADAEISRLEEELRTVKEANEELKALLEGHRDRAHSALSASTTAGTREDDCVDPSQVKFNPRATVVPMDDLGEDMLAEERDDEPLHSQSSKRLRANVSFSDIVKSGMSDTVAKASVLGKSRPVQVVIYSIAFLFVVFVLVASSYSLGALSDTLHAGEDIPQADAGHGDDTGHGDVVDHAEPSAGHRRLGGGVSPLLQNIAFCLTSCGLIAFIVGIFKQPLILGYLLGGVLVGPNFGLDLVHGHESVAEISNLGLVFLLFMIGLELDVKEILKMGRVVLLTGLLQFPICAGVQILIFSAVHAAGLSLGAGPYAAMYVGIACGISSTMIVVKLLSERGETERPNGRLTIGILIFQDIWAMVFLAIQPNLDNPDIVGLCKTFGMIAVLVVLALSYAKFVMPAILFYASKSVELMLVLSLAWCFFMGCTAHLPWIGIGMELAALIAGVALATFPYSAEFNGKIKYIRDFFITLFFAALGMQIPVPSFQPIATAVLVAVVVLLFRWLGIFGLVFLLGGGPRLGALATINLSQISEFALVICSLGMSYGHIDTETLTVIIWTFMILAILSSNMIGHNHAIYRAMARVVNKMRGKPPAVDDGDDHGHDEDRRDILLLGFHRIASMLVAEFEHNNPTILEKLQVVDVNESIKEPLKRRKVKFSYGDFSSPDVLEHAFHGEPKIVLSTTPDSMLQGITNAQILKVAKSVWPDAKIVVTADNPQQASMLYENGADYVLRSAKLCAERLFTLLDKFDSDEGASELTQNFQKFKKKDKDRRASFVMAKI
eukprot:gb/GFBE01025751.1/.p1 GENE.gb/GFBE01025751.1/~~gb/GFBE01025751.1/.p1  ORF type:complete len:801 (+),score=204.52 gb/GFBE01025751.1/:1-2403(+)